MVKFKHTLVLINGWPYYISDNLKIKNKNIVIFKFIKIRNNIIKILELISNFTFWLVY